MSKKGESRSNGRPGQSVLDAAADHVVPVAQQVVPMAKNAGQAARQGAQGAAHWVRPRVQGARTWAEPQVRAARSWAAPRVEQAGLAVRDKIAPTISTAIVEASHRLDAQPPQRRRRLWPRLVAAAAMLAAAASAAAAVIIKRQGDTVTAPEEADADGMPPAGGPSGATQATAEGVRPEGDGSIDGHTQTP
jgi:hypothetical protein